MIIDFDPAKDVTNIKKHGMSLSLAHDFEWSSAIVVEDTRRDYGEQRFTAFGLIGDRLFVVVFTMRA